MCSPHAFIREWRKCHLLKTLIDPLEATDIFINCSHNPCYVSNLKVPNLNSGFNHSELGITDVLSGY